MQHVDLHEDSTLGVESVDGTIDPKKFQQSKNNNQRIERYIWKPYGLPGSSILTSILVNYPRHPVIPPEVRWFFCVHFGGPNTFPGVWMSRANPPHQWIVQNHLSKTRSEDVWFSTPSLGHIQLYLYILYKPSCFLPPDFPSNTPVFHEPKCCIRAPIFWKAAVIALKTCKGSNDGPTWNYQRWSPWNIRAVYLPPKRKL